MYPFLSLTLKLRQLRTLLPKRDFVTATVFWLIISALLTIFSSLTTPFDNRLKDLKLKFNAEYVRSRIDEDILLLSIDSETLATAPHKWPWPQSYWAKLVRKIHTEGAPKALIIDVFFQTPEKDDQTELKIFAEALGETKKTGLVALYEEMVTGIGRQLKFVPPHKQLRANTNFFGLSQQPIDEDGKIRSFLLTDNRIDCRHIAWELLKFLGKPIAFAEEIEKHETGVALLDFAASNEGVTQLSIKQLLEDEGNFEYLKDRIVVLGATAPVLHDYHQTPLGLITGPEIICNCIATLGSGHFQLLRNTAGKRLFYYLAGALMALLIFSDFIKDNIRQMTIFWLLLPVFLFFYSFFPLEHPPVILTWFGYTITALIIFILLRFIEISELRQQLLEGEICGNIQKNFFPAENLLDERGLICYGRCIPQKDAGGDFYDFFKLKNNNIFFMLGDVTGHGISASMITTVAKSVVILESEKDAFDLENMLQEIGYTIFSMTNKRRMMSAVAGIIDLDTRKLTIASAGHLPTVMKSGSTATEIPLPGLPLGVSKKKKPMSIKEIKIPENGKLFVYSDGIIEGLNWNDQMLGYDTFYKLVADLPDGQTCEKDADDLMKSLQTHTQGRSFEDDVTLLIMDFAKREFEKK
ncbi:MAG: CHASE2 domain-containing protein [Erysipelotrichia bacterium]|nr:CHASE2 domain-containing protein [Candidatus Riflebacteria bacterium]NCB39130.1 CHASE2 domain-containing protein [Erysipelotrichia bacterium]